MNNCLKEIGEAIKKSTRILITGHVFPDGDSIGSVLGLGLTLESLKKDVVMVMQDKVPEIYQFLPGSAKIRLPQEVSSFLPDIIIFLDCTDMERAGTVWFEECVKDSVVINIDHHISNQHFGTLKYVDSQAAATSQIICRLLWEMGWGCSKEAATALYTGIVMDTGSFQYQNTSSEVLRTAADLLEKGIDLNDIRENLYENKSLDSLRVISLAINKLQISSDGRIAWIVLDKKTMHGINAKPENYEGLVNYAISVKGAKVGLLFKETSDGKVKVGLRCRNGFDVNHVAGHFGGGGHQLAAGCTLNGPMDAAVEKVLNAVRSYLGET